MTRLRANQALGAIVNSTSGSGDGLTCPFDRTRLEAVYASEATLRVRCTHGLLKGGEYHDFSLPSTAVERHYRSKGLKA